MSENSKPQDPERTAGQTSPPETAAQAADAPTAVVPESAGTPDTAATALTTRAGEKAGAHRAAAPAPAPASKVKLDPGFDPKADPMRAAARFPLLPIDEEIADSRAGNPEEPAADMYAEPTPTAMISMRPPAEEVARRQAAMEKAANTKPVLTRVFQVLIAVFYPIVLLVLSIRLVTSSVFLWIEYHRPGFPADSFGFSTEDRLTYGSYTVDYLLNFAPARYLGGLVNDTGNPLFLTREVEHMADVKSVIVMAFLTGLVLAVIMVIGMVYLARRSFGGIRRALFAGSIATLALIIGLGVFAVTGWEAFFTEFHKIFFKDGTWTFYTDDTLIRLFPSQFWTDSGIFIGVFVLAVSSLTLAFTWPTKDRRQAVASARHPGRRAA